MANEYAITMALLVAGEFILLIGFLVLRAQCIERDLDLWRTREELQKITQAVNTVQRAPVLASGFPAPGNTNQRALSEGVTFRRAEHHQETWEGAADPKLRRKVEVTIDPNPTPVPGSPETRREGSDHPQAVEGAGDEESERLTPDDATRPFSRADMPKGGPNRPKA